MRKGSVKDRVDWGGSVVVVEEEEEAVTFMDQQDGLAQMEVRIVIVIIRISRVYIKP